MARKLQAGNFESFLQGLRNAENVAKKDPRPMIRCDEYPYAKFIEDIEAVDS
jgi:hypothetical protein